MKKGVSIGVVLVVLMSMVVSVYASEHVVVKGDVLWKIASENKTSVSELATLNNLKDPNLIYPGQVIKLSSHKEAVNQESEVSNMTNADKVVALISSIESGDHAPVAYINSSKYIQHNLGVKDGLQGFGEVMAQLPEGSARASVKRVFEDGDFVFTHTEYNFFGPKIGFDIFRFEDGLIVEHWDNLTPVAETLNPAGRTQIDGTTEVKNIELTNANKTLVQGFVDDVLMGKAPEKIMDYLSAETYLQHNTVVGDGVESLGAALGAMAEAGTPMVYTDNHMVLGQGNFVLTVSEGQFLNEHVSFYDLFRIEDGKIVEHWDVIEEIPAKEQWMNQNGKF